MKRLTKGYEKHNNEFISYVADVSLYPNMMGYEYAQAEMDCINKLGKLEDLEQELGIDLITLFKALKEGIYTIHSKGKKRIPCLAYNGAVGYILDFIFKQEAQYILSDYKKTWALRKEDLEDEKKD